MRLRRLGMLVLGLATALPVASAPPVNVAVAANFGPTAKVLAAKFATRPDLEINITTGSSGKFYAQIEHGAPFDIFLSADAERPGQLEQKGFTVPGTRFTYAVGRMALVSVDGTLKGQDCKAALSGGKYRHVAIANPKVAPYGVAAVAVLRGLGLAPESLGERLVMGENISQVLQFVTSGSAQLGFVAVSQLKGKDAPVPACRWDVPADLHAPIVQQAVLLKRGEQSRVARDFHTYLQSGAARALIREDGYDVIP